MYGGFTFPNPPNKSTSCGAENANNSEKRCGRNIQRAVDMIQSKQNGKAIEENKRETRVAVISSIVEKAESVAGLNELLHEYGEYIIGRMGIPYRAKGINIISVAIDAPLDKINALTGSIGKLDGISAKAAYSKQN